MSESKKCPFCKEEIKADASKCKHCGSIIAPEKPSHTCICPYGKESTNPEAIKCKHCFSFIGPYDSTKCNCDNKFLRGQKWFLPQERDIQRLGIKILNPEDFIQKAPPRVGLPTLLGIYPRGSTYRSSFFYIIVIHLKNLGFTEPATN